MAASRLCSAAAMAAIAAAFTSMSMSQNRAYADSRFRFPFFSSSPPPSDSPANQSSSNSSKSKPEPDEPKGSGFDPESLERAAKALRDINSSPHSKQVFDLMRKQEKTRLAELAVETSHYEAIQAHIDIERLHKLAEDQRNLLQTQAQTKAQILRYEDELARKRQQVVIKKSPSSFITHLRLSQSRFSSQFSIWLDKGNMNPNSTTKTPKSQNDVVLFRCLMRFHRVQNAVVLNAHVSSLSASVNGTVTLSNDLRFSTGFK